jgi:hypothetical protein
MLARVLAMALLLRPGVGAVLPVHGQDADVIYCRRPVFRIPFQIEPGEQGRVREVQLYISEDQRTWRFHSAVSPAERHFQFTSQRDGMYWFTVRTQDLDGRLTPASLDGLRPGLQVVIDTILPEARLTPLQARGEQVGVEWEVRDANIDLQTLQLEYRPQGAGEWQPLTADPQLTGQKYWSSLVRGAIHVRLRVRDKAENQGTAQVVLGGSGGQASGVRGQESGVRSQGFEARPEASPRASGMPAAASVKIVNTTKIGLNYTLEEVGPSGVSLVELWYTLDGRSWQRYGEDEDKTSPFQMEVNGEGAYGLTLVVRSGVGMGDRPPQSGDAPQMWIEVDLTKPVVQLLSVEPGRGTDAGNLTVTWQAYDKNLAATPISLSYAEQAEGPWKSMAAGLDNTGRYVWRIPSAAPYRFFVRVEAADRGGNIGRAETAKPIAVDLAIPKGRLQGVEGQK